MAGKKGFSGRHKRIDAITADGLANLSLRTYIAALNDESISPLDKAKLALPIVAKRLPDKLEATVLNTQISEDMAKQFLEVYRRNVLIYKELDNVERKKIAQQGQDPLKDKLGMSTALSESMPLSESLSESIADSLPSSQPEHPSIAGEAEPIAGDSNS